MKYALRVALIAVTLALLATGPATAAGRTLPAQVPPPSPACISETDYDPVRVALIQASGDLLNVGTVGGQSAALRMSQLHAKSAASPMQIIVPDGGRWTWVCP